MYEEKRNMERTRFKAAREGGGLQPTNRFRISRRPSHYRGLE